MDPKDLVGATAPAEPEQVAVSEPENTAVATLEQPAEAPAPAPEPTVPEPEPEPPDLRQWWVCVDPEGPRHKRAGVECPEFQSDSHVVGHLDEHGYPQPPVPVECPTCGSKSVRKRGAEVKMDERGRALPQ